jgi:hypothetical protein
MDPQCQRFREPARFTFPSIAGGLAALPGGAR